MSDLGKDDCVILNKYIYSLFQAALHYFEAVEILKNLGFVRNVDPFLYVKKSANGPVYVALYANDN